MKHVPIQLHNNVISCLRSKLQLAKEETGITFVEPTICYRSKGRIAGTAHLKEWLIQLNVDMLITHQQPFIDEVVPHELAHLINYKLNGRVKPHGLEWRQIMINIMKEIPQTTHHFQIQSDKTKSYDYTCQCQTHQLSTIRHNRIQQKKIKYFCKKCNNELLFLPNSVKQ